MSLDTGDEGLPTFERPPVVEVVLGVRFAPLPFGAFELAQSYELWRDAYPAVQEYPSIPTSPSGGFFLEMGGGAPDLRFWFINPDNTRIIQVQKDRVVVNWRWQDGNETYPRFSKLRSELIRRFNDFSNYAKSRGVEVLPVATEVTYVNLIGVETRISLTEVVNFIEQPPVFRDSPAEADVQMRFDTSVAAGIPSNLAFSTSRDVSRDPAPIVMQLSSHAQVAPGDDYAAALDVGHRLVVTTFRDLTTESMHRSWGLI